MNTKKLLVIGFTWPEPKATAAGNRMLQLLRFFSVHDYEITFTSTANESALSLDLESMGIQKTGIRLNDASFDDFIKGLRPDIVLFDRFLTEEQFGWRVAELVPNAVRILDTEDLHALRKARELAFKDHVACTTAYWLRTDMCKRELASIFRSDLSLMISSYEMNLLQETVKIDGAIVLHLPFMLKPIKTNEAKTWRSFEERTDFICIGNGKHVPNADAVLWLKKEIWPLIRKQIPDAKIHIYGAYLPKHLLQMNNPKAGFLVHGWASDVKSVMQNAKVNLAPLRFGAGLKGKLIDAIQEGTPSVTTTIGAEGMHDGSEFFGSIADDAQTFADKSVELFKNRTRWIRAQQIGVNLVNTNYDAIALEKRLLSKIDSITDSLDRHRTQNVIGQVLLHQSMASTKYMAKWIEEKNKNK